MGTRDITLQIARRYLEDEGIGTVPIVAADELRRACPPLFAPPVAAPAELAGVSVDSYYRRANGALSDDFATNECYHNRQCMLLSAYRHFLGADIARTSFVDVGGSNGYYAFHAARLGFRDVVCIDGRAEHAAQFAQLRALARCEDAEFAQMNVEQLDGLRAFDVVSAQGILHHLYDHLAFVRALRKITRRLLIVDVHLNGRIEPSADLCIEVAANLRDSPFSPLSLTPSLSTLVELLKAAGFASIHHVPYPDRLVRDDGARTDHYGYGKLRRIMLAAVPPEARA